MNISPIRKALKQRQSIFIILVLTGVGNTNKILAGRQVRSETRRVLIPLIMQESIVGPGGAIHDAKAFSVAAYIEILTVRLQERGLQYLCATI